MTRWLAVAFLLTMAGLGRADEQVDAWTAGSRAFRTGRERLQMGQPSRAFFRGAAVRFAAAVDPLHAEAYLNLGNAHYLAGELPEAIAAFNAGLAVDPSDGRLVENLALARRDASPPADSKLIAPASAWQRYLFQPWLGVVAVTGLIGSSLLLPVSLRLGRSRWAAAGVILSLIAAVAGGAIVVRENYVDDMGRRPVCVIRIDTPLRTGNAERYPPQSDAPLLPRGYEVRRLGQRGGWLHVECPGGTIGWAPEGNVIQTDAPRASASRS